MYSVFGSRNPRDLTIDQLIDLRNKLIQEISKFERCRDYWETKQIVYPTPSRGLMYRCNLDAIGRICDEISRKYKEQQQEKRREKIRHMSGK